MSVGVVAAYMFLFVSKKKGLIYGTGVLAVLILTLLFINFFLKCYFLDVILSNAGNSILSTSHMVEQSTRFITIFLPSFLMFLLAVFAKRGNHPLPAIKKNLAKQDWLNIFHLDQPLLRLSLNYFWFFFLCSTAVVVCWLGRHMGSYMSYYFQLITPALVLGVFQHKDILRNHAVVTVPLILINISIICLVALYPNRLSLSQEKEWKKLYQYLGNSSQVLNSPVLVPEMIRLGLMPVDSGQSEYFFSIMPYGPNPFAPDYKAVRLQGINYLRSIRTKVLHQRFDHVMITFDPGYSPFAGRAVIDKYYDRVELLHLAMPQTNQYWTIEISELPK
jgi:hypothetical protein